MHTTKVALGMIRCILRLSTFKYVDSFFMDKRSGGIIYLHINWKFQLFLEFKLYCYAGAMHCIEDDLNHSTGGGYASIDGLLNEVVFYVWIRH